MVGAFTAQLRDARRSHGRAGRRVGLDRDPSRSLPHRTQGASSRDVPDLRHAVRVFAASPGFTLVAVLSLALGIGANAAIFSLLNSVLMSTLPVRNAHELVILTNPGSRGVAVGSQGGDRALLSYEEFRQLQDGNHSFVSLMASSSSLQRIEVRVASGNPEEIAIRLVSASYFSTLGVSPFLGSGFDSTHEPAPGAAPQAVIGYDYWQRRFGGRSDAIGRTITLANGIVSVIGVAPASFFGETVGERPDVWIPLAMQSAVLPGRDWLHDAPGSAEKTMWLHAFGRLRPGVTLDSRAGRRERHLQAGAHGLLLIDRRPDRTKAIRQSKSEAECRCDWRLVGARDVFGAADRAARTRGPRAADLRARISATCCWHAPPHARARCRSPRAGRKPRPLIRQLLTESLLLATAGGVAGWWRHCCFARACLRWLVIRRSCSLPR
jgi:hypothetical protein